MDAAHLFDPVSPRRTSDRVARAIRARILEGRLRPGERLPPERTLADRFGVTRNTVREAVRQLERARLVSVRHGSGVRVLDYLSTAGVEFLGALLASGPDPAGVLRDLLQARAVLGRAICGASIDRFDPTQLDALRHAVDAFAAEAARERPAARALQTLDFEVHTRLVRGGGNRVFVLLYNSLRQVYEPVQHLFEGLVGDPARLAALYRRCVEALAAGDRDGARRAFDAVFDIGEPR